MKRPRLTYFDIRGRAEAIRLHLHATATDFDDHRVASADEWAALKPTLPFGALPTYEAPEGFLCESHAILRYLGQLVTPVAPNRFGRAELDSAHDAIAESQEDLWRFNWREDYYDHLESYAESTLSIRLDRLQACLARGSDTGEWFGPRFTHVDCLAFCYLDEIDAFFPAVLAQFPELAEFFRRVASRPGISDYLNSDARPPVFGMGRMGPKVDPRVTIAPGSLFTNPWTKPIELTQIERAQRRLTRR